ncbi:MAG: sulfatase [Verrucomicrobiales bacterium]|nr:sulfatase [Verrucomicrobiales bacterium]
MRLLLIYLLALFFSSATAGPNIVLIFVDDLGYGDIGCYGSKLNKTPNLDKLAAEGQRWTSFYASGSTCVPSRRGLMTGSHPALLKAAKLVNHRNELLPAMLQKQGYATAILGKWHLAGYPKDFTSSEMHPLECGFDYHFGTPGSNDVPPPPGKKQTREVFDNCDKFSFPVPLIRGREVVEHPVNQELLTKRYTEEAVKWITEKKNERFFLYLAHNMPHAPVFASPEFQGKSENGRYGDVIEEIDWSVGQVMATINKLDLDRQTLVVFTSDNGPWSMFGPHGGTAKPLRGEKGTSWEGGFRVPGIFRWPGTIKPGEVSGIGANLDLYATFAKLTGGSLPGHIPGGISRDLSETLLNDAPSPRTTWYYPGGSEAWRSGNYKIHTMTKVRSSDPDTRKRAPVEVHNPPLLFDLSTDIGEERDISGENPEISARLLSEMRTFKKAK